MFFFGALHSLHAGENGVDSDVFYLFFLCLRTRSAVRMAARRRSYRFSIARHAVSVISIPFCRIHCSMTSFLNDPGNRRSTSSDVMARSKLSEIAFLTSDLSESEMWL